MSIELVQSGWNCLLSVANTDISFNQIATKWLENETDNQIPNLISSRNITFLKNGLGDDHFKEIENNLQNTSEGKVKQLSENALATIGTTSAGLATVACVTEALITKEIKNPLLHLGILGSASVWLTRDISKLFIKPIIKSQVNTNLKNFIHSEGMDRAANN